MLKVLKAVAEYQDVTLADLVEGIVLHALEGTSPFDAAARQRIDEIRRIYGLELTAQDARLGAPSGEPAATAPADPSGVPSSDPASPNRAATPPGEPTGAPERAAAAGAVSPPQTLEEVFDSLSRILQGTTKEGGDTPS